MKIQCPNCAESTELTLQVDWQDFACPHCQTLYQKDSDGNLAQRRFLPKAKIPIHLFIGQQGVIEGVLWEVGNVAVKYTEDGAYSWQEYTLYNAKKEVCFLSEYFGHWMLAREIEDSAPFDIQNNEGYNYQEVFYPIFHDSNFRTEYAAGFFDHPLPEKGKAKDFIHPPQALLLESYDGAPKTYAFEARRFTQKELRAAFQDTVLPDPIGRDILAPFPVDFSGLGTIFGIVGGLIIVCQILLASYFPSNLVLKERVTLPDTLASVTHISPSFTVEGLNAPLQIELTAPVDNSWTDVDFCLLNETTKAERYGYVGVAYYHGWEDGESWSEGSTRPSIKICGVSPGVYHLTMEIAKAPNTPSITSLSYTVTSRSSTYGNLFLALGLLIATAVGVFFWKQSFERNRWLESDFPPETDEEEY